MYNYNNNRIIAIGDIHGDYYIFIELLKLARVIDKNLNWIGKDTYVIQVGDTLDGKRPNITMDKDYINTTGEIEIIKLILSLDANAKDAGGRVISILGNHELYPYYYYNDKSFNNDYVKTADLDMYKKLYNTSRFNYFKPGSGKGAKILGKTRPLILQLGQFIFTHGSLSPEFLKLCIENDMNKSNTNKVDLNKLNKLVSNWLTGNSSKVPFFINRSDVYNPLFNRTLCNPKTMSKDKCQNLLDNIFKYLNEANYLVMGHSTHRNINTLCNNRVYRTDIGISRGFGESLNKKLSRLQVLEIKQKGNKVNTNIITPEGKIKII